MATGWCPVCSAQWRRVGLMGVDLTSRAALSVAVTLALAAMDVLVVMPSVRHGRHGWREFTLGMSVAAVLRLALTWMAWPFLVHFTHRRSAGGTWWQAVACVLFIPAVVWMRFYAQWALDWLY